MKIIFSIMAIHFLTFTCARGESNCFHPAKLYTYAVYGDSFITPPWSLQDSNAKAMWMDYFLQIGTIEPNKVTFQPHSFRIYNGTTHDEITINSKIRNDLESPVEVTMSSAGQVSSMKAQSTLSAWAMRMKKGQVSRFMLNTGLNSSNTIVPDQYAVEERSILGHCVTRYSVREERMPRKAPTFHRYLHKRDIWAEHESWDPWVNNIEARVNLGYKHGISTEWNGPLTAYHEEVPDYYAELFQFCEPNSMLFEFRKIVEPENCHNYDTRKNESGIMSATQFIACGPHRQNVTILEISHALSNVGVSRTQTTTLVHVDKMKPNQLREIPDPAMDIQDLSFGSIIEGARRPTASPQTTEKLSNRNRDSRFRSCLVDRGVNIHKLVSRDLNSNLYNRLNHQWNLRIKQVYPRSYFLPTTAQDVASAVKCGLAVRLHLVPNSGGHSYESIGYGNNDTVIVDFRNMNGTSIERRGREAIGRLEPGALVGAVNAYFWENGGFALPMGNCMTVGMGGHAIGGGVGYFTSQYGLTLDNVIEFEVVDGRGDIVVANENVNSDLFWALRGAGPGYVGIVTSFRAKLFNARKISITVAQLQYTISDFASSYIAFQNMQQWIRVNDPTAGLSAVIVNDNYNATQPQLTGGIRYTVVRIQNDDEDGRGNATIFRAFYRIFPRPLSMIQFSPNYIQFVGITAYSPVTQQGIKVPSPPSRTQRLTDAQYLSFFNSLRKEDASSRYLKVKSLFVKRFFSLAEMERVGRVMRRIPHNSIYILISPETGLIHRVRKNETAYVHRDSQFNFAIHHESSTDPRQVQEGRNFMYSLWNSIQFMDGGETYQNYPDFEVENHLDRFYGQNLNGLIEQKRKWDPTNFFVTPLSIP